MGSYDMDAAVVTANRKMPFEGVYPGLTQTPTGLVGSQTTGPINNKKES